MRDGLRGKESGCQMISIARFSRMRTKDKCIFGLEEYALNDISY